ncbi:MAG: protein-disulfide reductase DsbD domain-containing protein [Bacteroidota bacterium]
MKRFFLVFILSAVVTACFGQAADPVALSFSAKKINATTYEVHLTATMEEGWHIYSQTTPDGGPVPTEITFKKNPLLAVEGSPKEIGKLEQRHEVLFGVDVKQFSGKVDFVQVVKVKANAKTNISGTVKFMTCNDEMCMPPTSVPFNISLK